MYLVVAAIIYGICLFTFVDSWLWRGIFIAIGVGCFLAPLFPLNALFFVVMAGGFAARSKFKKLQQMNRY